MKYQSSVLTSILVVFGMFASTTYAQDNQTLSRDDFNIEVTDRDAQPLIRIPPIMPPRAKWSGYCNLEFDVSPEGQPFNISARSCTEKLFERASIQSVRKWKYNPKIVDGKPVSRTGVQSKISFKLLDERGNILPEKTAKCQNYSGIIGEHHAFFHVLPIDGDASYEGQICDYTLQGQGKVKFSNGSWYEGLFDVGMIASGQGYQIPEDREEGIYTGAFKNNEFHGRGKLVLSLEGKVYTYNGQFAEGQPHGKGELKSTHGEWFSGSYIEGDLSTGIGKISFDNDVLEGNFVDGMLVESSSDSFVKWVPKTKFASLELSDGGSYKGMVTRGIDPQPHGKGTLIYEDRGLTYEGEFELGTFREGKKTEEKVEDFTIRRNIYILQNGRVVDYKICRFIDDGQDLQPCQ